MPSTKQRRGRRGEAIALRYLRRKGYVLVDRNIHTRYGEVDLVCLDRGTLVFIEVKLRTTDTFGEPIDGVSPAKLLRLYRTIEVFLVEHRWHRDFRIEIVGIMLRGGRARVEHLKTL